MVPINQRAQVIFMGKFLVDNIITQQKSPPCNGEHGHWGCPIKLCHHGVSEMLFPVILSLEYKRAHVARTRPISIKEERHQTMRAKP